MVASRCQAGRLGLACPNLASGRTSFTVHSPYRENASTFYGFTGVPRFVFNATAFDSVGTIMPYPASLIFTS